MAEQLKDIKEEWAICHICGKLLSTRGCWYFPSVNDQNLFQTHQNILGQGNNLARQASNFWSPKNILQGRIDIFTEQSGRGNDNHIPRFNRGR